MKTKRVVQKNDRQPLIRDLGICAFLVLLVAGVFLSVRGFEFLLYDDGRIVYENPNIASGLRWDNVVWAFTHAHFAIWMPLTSISHMIDASLFGAWAGGHHLTSLVLHALAAALLYLALRSLTRRPWPSAICAALFAVHPQRAEAVGWVSSRKEILCGLFFFAALWAYARYARGPTVRRMSVVVLLGAFALMSKPMAITLPFLLLLLDWWPLERLTSEGPGRTGITRLFVEKVPLFLLVAAVSVVAVFTQPEVSDITAVDAPPLLLRLGHAALCYMRYLWNGVCPVELAAHYPFLSDAVTVGRVAGASTLLGAITVAVILDRRKAYFPVGWFWFLGTLMPVLGLVQYGNAAMADRYTYIPQVGLLIMLVWGISDFVVWFCNRDPVTAAVVTGKKHAAVRPLSLARTGFAGVALAISLVLTANAALCHWQLGFWRNTALLFERSIALQPCSALAHANLGMTALKKGDKEEALHCYREAVRLEPEHAVWLYNLGSMLVLIKHYGEAADVLRRSLERNPNNPPAWGNLGVCVLETGAAEDALRHFDEAIRLNPEKANYFINRAEALSKLGRTEDAVEALERAHALQPGNREAATQLNRARRTANQPRPSQTD